MSGGQATVLPIPPPPVPELTPELGKKRTDSLTGGAVRALLGTLAFVFKRPVRLFRPVKLSSWMLLQAQASRDGRRLSPRYLYTHARSLPHLLIPPLIVNTAVGFTLFETYTYTEARLLSRSSPRPSPGPSPTPLWIVATAGGAAGLAQSLLSAPLDNVRYVLQRGDPLRWHTVLVAIRAPFSPTAHFQPRFFTAALALSLARDAIGFAAFFSLFELSRRAAAHVNAEKSTTSRLAAVSTLLAGGALGAMAYEAAGKPFDRMRSTIWNARERAPNAPTSPYSILKSHANKKRSAFAYTYFVAPFTRRKTLNPQPWATRTLRRLATPYGVAFLAFAWMGGDLD